MNYSEAVAWLHSLPRPAETGMTGLESARMLLRELGNPQSGLRFVHVAGTNGKGSTAMMLASILKEAGYRVGSSISPYVLDFRERFLLNGEMIGQPSLARLAQRVQNAALAMQHKAGALPSEFSAVVALALLWFAESNCDIVVLEAGIGGDTDATNVIQNTLVACLCSIGLDHTAQLGSTVAEIARHKCGILKPGCTAVCYPRQPQEALDEIVLAAQKNGCELVLPEMQDLALHKGRPLENRFNYGGYEITLPFPGRHQAINAAVAIEAALALWRKGYAVEDDAILRGLYKVKFPARIELISRDPFVILDGCHNPDGAAALADTLGRSRLEGLSAVVGVMGDKDAAGMLRRLAGSFDRVYTVTPQGPRALPAEELAHLAKRHFAKVRPCASLQEALSLADEDGSEGCVVCGSLFLAAEARKLFFPD